jgi:hypothetical protein
MAISGFLGGIYVSQGAPVAFTNQTLTDTAATRLKYRISDASKRYWDKNTPVVIQQSINGGSTWTTVAASDYFVDYIGGEVTFLAARAAGTLVRGTGASLTIQQVGGFFNWSLDIEMEFEDSTTFESNGWKESTPTLLSSTGSADRYWATTADFFNLLGSDLILVLYLDKNTSRRYEGLFKLSSNSVETPVDALIEESIDYESTEKIYYREG